MKHLLILGANSDIGKSIARQYAANGYNITLACRNITRLDDFVKDLSIRSKTEVNLVEFDLLVYQAHQAFLTSLSAEIDSVICVVGYLGEQQKAQSNIVEFQRITDTNYTACALILSLIANDFEKKQYGFIAAVSSVAGERGRQTNYVYGSAKAALTAFMSGLRNRLAKSHVQVLTIKPGFVDTQMTKDMDLPKRLTATPEEVAVAVYNGHKKGKNIIYVKPIWRVIMFVIRLIPEMLFKKMSL